jgi:hypothetical protein
MTLGILLFCTVACICWALWVRHATWKCDRWDLGPTYLVLLSGLTVYLISPLGTVTAGVLLHKLIGRWNLEDYSGHMCAIAGTSSIIYHGLLRIDLDDDRAARRFEHNVWRPITLVMPLLFALYWCSDVTRHYETDLFDAYNDGWLKCYWVALCSVYIYLLGYGARAWLTLRHDPLSRATALFYFWGSVFSIAACLFRIKGTIWGPVPGHWGVWICTCLGVVLFSVGAGRSWIQRTRLTSTDDPDLVPH